MSMRIVLVLTLAAGAFLIGCGSSQTQSSSPEKAVLSGPLPDIDGVEIVKDDGTYIYYKQKCYSCGFVSPKTQRMAAPTKGKAILSAFICPKCGKAQRIRIAKP